MSSKFKVETTVDTAALERIAASGIERALASPEGLEGTCPSCGAALTLRAPETTCPTCGARFTPQVSLPR